MTKHTIHIIKKDETLQSIAKLYNISVEELRIYHNTYCELSDLLEVSITNQTHILIPPKKENEKIKVKLDKNNHLLYHPIQSKYEYGVIITMEDGEEKNELKYETSVKWVQKYEDLHIFEIDRLSKMYVNEEEVNSIADRLAYETSKVLFPMHIMVDGYGNWEGVAKYNKYPERWKNIKKQIYREFEGEIVEEYLKKVEKVLENPQQIEFYMGGDFFLRSLFLGYCMRYDNDFTAEKHISFPIVSNGIEPNYKVKVKIEPYLDEYNFICVEIEGVLADERSPIDFINGNLFATETYQGVPFGKLWVKVFLNPNSCIPETLHLECSMDLEKTKKVSVIIANLAERELQVRNKNNSMLG
ncbi:LysM peptidoglycan-binding domain-containing protein [Capnocytophaga canis]|uniref:LysM peptidoglycan-binding domain-containing protein n=1 Tax=Capnocytophaga canis TaxID=1848903 RepID=UPI00370DE011